MKHKLSTEQVILSGSNYAELVDTIEALEAKATAYDTIERDFKEGITEFLKALNQSFSFDVEQVGDAILGAVKNYEIVIQSGISERPALLFRTKPPR